MWAIKYSRILVQLFLVAAYLAVAIWAVRAEHRWIPLLALAAYFAANMLILPRLPRPKMTSQEIHFSMQKVASSYRRLAVMSTFGLTLTTLMLLLTRFRLQGLPGWAVVLTLLWAWFLLGCYFWCARWYRRKAEETLVGTDKGQGKEPLPPHPWHPSS